MTPTLQACTHPAQGYNCPDLFKHKILFSQTVKQAHFFLCTSAHTHTQTETNRAFTERVSIQHYVHRHGQYKKSLQTFCVLCPSKPRSSKAAPLSTPYSDPPTHSCCSWFCCLLFFPLRVALFFPRALKYIYPEHLTLFTLSPHLPPPHQKNNNKFHKRELITEIILHK